MSKKDFQKSIIGALPYAFKEIGNHIKSLSKEDWVETIDSTTGIVGVAARLFAQPLVNGYFEKKEEEKLNNFGLGIYIKVAFEQANNSLQCIEEIYGKNETFSKDLFEIHKKYINEIDNVDTETILFIFQPKYHPAIMHVRKTYFWILKEIGIPYDVRNTFLKDFNQNIEQKIKEEFGDSYQNHLDETKLYRITEIEADHLMKTYQLGKIGFKDYEDLKYMTTYAEWKKTSELWDQYEDHLDKKSFDKIEQKQKPIKELIKEYFENEPNSNLNKILFAVADFGKGKSVFLRKYASDLAKEYLDTDNGLFPVYYNLNQYQKSDSQLGVIGDYLINERGINIQNEHFNKKRFIFLIDSLDESGELTQRAVRDVIFSVKKVSSFNEYNRDVRMIVTSRPFDNGLKDLLEDKNHKPYVINQAENKSSQSFISIYGFRKEQFNEWIYNELNQLKKNGIIDKLEVTGFAKEIIESVITNKTFDIYESLVSKNILSRSELRRPIFAYMIYQLIKNQIDFASVGKIGIYLSFINLLTREAKHIHDQNIKVNLPDEFASRNILHAIAALWQQKRQMGNQTALHKADICRVIEGKVIDENNEIVLEKNKHITDLNFLSHSYFGENKSLLHFQHQSFAEVLLAEYYLKVFIRFALLKPCDHEMPRLKLLLGEPTEQTISFFRELLKLFRESIDEKSNSLQEKRKLLFPFLASIANEKNNKQLFSEFLFLKWYEDLKFEENEAEIPIKYLENWPLKKNHLDDIVSMAADIINSKTTYFNSKVNLKETLYQKDIVELLNKNLNEIPPDIDKWIALLVGNTLYNDFENKVKPKLFNWDKEISPTGLFSMIKNWNFVNRISAPSWANTLFQGIRMEKGEALFHLYIACVRLNFSNSHFKNVELSHSNFRGCNFSNVVFENFRATFSHFDRANFDNIKLIGSFDISTSQIYQGVLVPNPLVEKLNRSDDYIVNSNFGARYAIINDLGNMKDLFIPLKGLFKVAIRNGLSTNELFKLFRFRNKNHKVAFYNFLKELESETV